MNVPSPQLNAVHTASRREASTVNSVDDTSSALKQEDVMELVENHAFRRDFDLKGRLENMLALVTSFEALNARSPPLNERIEQVTRIKTTARQLEAMLTGLWYEDEEHLGGNHRVERDKRTLDRLCRDALTASEGLTDRRRNGTPPLPIAPRVAVQELHHIYMDGTGQTCSDTIDWTGEIYGPFVEFLKEACALLEIERPSNAAIRTYFSESGEFLLYCTSDKRPTFVTCRIHLRNI